MSTNLDENRPFACSPPFFDVTGRKRAVKLGLEANRQLRLNPRYGERAEAT